jgi:hypothetical protein
VGVMRPAALKIVAHCREFLEQNFKTYMIVCSGVKHVSNLKEVIYNAYTNIIYKLYYGLYQEI